jgi:hypothetical protein
MSVSNTIADALKDTLDTEWANYSDNKKPRWYSTPEEIGSPQCPAVLIFDSGSTTEYETMRGGGDTPNAGWVSEDYAFDIVVYVKGRKKGDTLTEINEYRDTIKALFQDKFDLGGIAVDVRVQSDEPSMPWGPDSAMTRAGIVRIVVNTYSLQGTATLVG